MTGWFRPEALYLEGNLWTGRSLYLRNGYCVEVTEATPPETRLLPGLLSPSWINAHTHLELSHCRVPPSLGLPAFIAQMGPQRGTAETAVIYQALEIARQQGTTAFVSHQNSPLSREAIPPGVQVWPLAEFFGLAPKRCTAVWMKANALGYPLTPHSLYALSRRLHRRARRPAPFPKSLHFYESIEEKLWLERRTGPLRPFLKSFYRHPYVPSLRRVLHRLARRAPALWLVHATEAPLPSLQRWLSEIPNLYLVLCPLANYHLFRRRPPLRPLAAWSNRILLGTDSLANTPTLSLWPTIRHLYQSSWDWSSILRAAVDNPRRWLKVPPNWVLVGPLAENLHILPNTEARLFA